MTTILDSSDLMGGRNGSAGTRDAAAFRAARRHSHVVRLFRKAIPVSAVLALAVFVLGPILSPLGAIGGLSMGPISLSGSKVTMEKPKLTGFRKDNRPYEVTAVSATQDIRKPNTVELNIMKARLETEQGGWVRLESKTGVFDSQKEQMQLTDQIKVATDAGYEAFLKSADIDFKAGTIRSKEPVQVNMGTIRITADTLDVSDNGKIIVFNGRVNTVIDNSEQVQPPEKKPAARTVTPDQQVRKLP
jgi:lipopolysaccharide export system protein LptC